MATAGAEVPGLSTGAILETVATSTPEGTGEIAVVAASKTGTKAAGFRNSRRSSRIYHSWILPGFHRLRQPFQTA
ncbi:Hypothetical predicted protein [Podarcis lilfordi]|uniref:Uncharacterized protein n=1 Tax=Podarcis lilfordi TaxID=74358 RepID=A0AA35P0G2_9SAUR|nr:Hypothetical predicted protein [Podarcis lilfordi]